MNIDAKIKLKYVGDVEGLKAVPWALNTITRSRGRKFYEVFPDGSDSMFRATVPAEHFEIVSVDREVVEGYFRVT